MENNSKAISRYKKCGFKIKRKFNCYEIKKKNSGNSDLIVNYNNEFKDFNNIDNYCSFKPSWQNSYESFMNIKSKYSILSLSNKDNQIGYSIIDINNGNLMQLGLAPAYMNKKNIEIILSELFKLTSLDVIKYLNIENECKLD